ncbi:MAG: type II toxin-antitoxin system HicA family toxin [Bacteroidetes bacterium]|nr:type II toxin-antitoxin system HicA family toxin [Bacteroidota bacterium]MBS1540584.1 type II toxin-antitoxin system HicA family toxin [Bacteroidota bacterium]
MRLPHDLSGNDLIKNLHKLGYLVTRQKGSHVRLTCIIEDGQHHITIPNHDPIKIGTLSKILSEIAQVHQISKEEIVNKLF